MKQRPVRDRKAEDDQREALKRSEKVAAGKQPENFKDAENEDKTVEIGPDVSDRPIRGIDPKR